MKKSLSGAVVESPIIRSYRELLGLNSGASEEELKKAYRRLAQIYHPDKNPDPACREQFLKITEAYEILMDPAQIKKANKSYLDRKLFDFPIEGLNVSFGSFFGYRKFSLKRIEKKWRLGKEKPGEEDGDLGIYDLSHSEDSHSILDNPAYDSIELVYAGKFSLNDEERVMTGFKSLNLGQLPWIVLNNRGIICFLEGRFSDALKCYEELNQRIPQNIIFIYRLGLCYAITAFKKQSKGFFGSVKPEPAAFKKAVDFLRMAIAIGENRAVGKQKCMTIRKTLADIFERAGQKGNARRIWKEIRLVDPESSEALYKLGRKIGMVAGRRKTL